MGSKVNWVLFLHNSSVVAIVGDHSLNILIFSQLCFERGDILEVTKVGNKTVIDLIKIILYI